MTPTQQIRSAGLDGLKELEKRSGVIHETLRNWFKSRRWVFDACVEKAAREKRMEPLQARDALFIYMKQNHGLVLTESELDSVIYCVMGELKTTGEQK